MIRPEQYPTGKHINNDVNFDNSKVYTIASIAHNGQIRKDGSPYITHPLRIANRVFNNTQNNSMWAAALLHDTVEDSDGRVTLEMISDIVSPFVAALVDNLTHRKGEDYFAYLHRAIGNHYSAHIKRSDILDNMADLDYNHKNYMKYVRALGMIAAAYPNGNPENV